MFISLIVLKLLICTSFVKANKDDNKIDEIDHHRVDRESLLGTDFENLSIDDSKLKLGEIVDKIDKDKNGFVTLKELELWIKNVQKKFIERDVEKNWKIHNPNSLEKLPWAEYRDG